MSKPAKLAAAPAADAPPKKSNKKLIIIIAAVILLAGGGAAAFLLKKPHPPADIAAGGEHTEEIQAEAPAKFIDLGTFTANLIHEEGDRYLQVAISLKLTKPELEEKIKAHNPEILHHVNMLLQSKRPSELASFAGKEQLAQQIKGQVEYVLGLRKTAPAIEEKSGDGNTAKTAPAEELGSKSDEGSVAKSVPAEAPAHKSDGGNATKVASVEAPSSKSGIAEVLFTSFIVQ